MKKYRDEQGKDKHSVAADPGFKDASSGDFSVDENSPIHNLNIKLLDINQSGLLQDRIK